MSQPTTAGGRVNERLRRMSLRLRLVAVVLVLLIIALTTTGLASGLLIRRYLIESIDTELRAYANVAATLALASSSLDDISLLPPDYSVYVIPVGVSITRPQPIVQAATVTDVPDLPLMAPNDPRVVSGEPFTVRSIGGDSSWRVVAVVNRANDAVYAVAKPTAGVVRTLERFTWVASLVSVAVLILCAIIGWYAVRRAFRPLTEIEDTAAKIARGDLTQRVPSRPSSDEVASLAASLNVMLGTIERSFAVQAESEAKMRQFVADASHELRTPLATMRGYAELYRQGAVRSPDDVAGAMNRIESEATRMSGLVEDLLVLARLDSERPLRIGEVDLAVLGGDAVQDARALAPDRAIRLVGLGGPLGPCIVPGDEARLRQVFTNLIANAIRHTPPGSPIDIAVGRAGDGLAGFEVRDHGNGVDPANVRRVFERFFRADPSRARGRGGGNGLGLAIVAAIVNAHSGSVTVSQTPGGGATFGVHLPTANSQAPLSRV